MKKMCLKNNKISKCNSLELHDDILRTKFRRLRQRTNKPAHEGESLLSLHLIPLTSHLL